MSDQNRKYYSRSKEILKDEIYFKISDNSDHENKFLVEKIETKNKKKFIKQYKLFKNELNFLIYSLKKKNIKVISSIKYDNSLESNNQINTNHPEYVNGNLLHLDSYKKTITAKFDDINYPINNSQQKIKSYPSQDNYYEIN